MTLFSARTALYGPVRRVVWEGGAVRLLPIPIVDFNPRVRAMMTPRRVSDACIIRAYVMRRDATRTKSPAVTVR